jgi:hypothetical protein
MLSISRLGFVASVLALAGCSGERLVVGTNEAGTPAAGPDASAQDAADEDARPEPSGIYPGTSCSDLEAQSLWIRQNACGQCHGSPPGQAGLYWILSDYDLVTEVPVDVTAPVVIPGDPNDSLLYERMATRTLNQANVTGMPPTQTQLSIFLSPADAQTVVYPNSQDLEVIYNWILYCLGVDGRNASFDAAAEATLPPPADATPPSDASVRDAANAPDVSFPIDVEVSPPPAGEAGIALIVNGIVQTPLSCPANNWEFWPVDSAGNPLCDPSNLLCTVSSAVLENSGSVPVTYTVQPEWNTPGVYPPGIAIGDSNELVGVLAPGAELDITQAFVGGITAVLGSSLPFSDYDAHFVLDEGNIPWPGGLGGSEGASVMWTAQIDMEPACRSVITYW